MLGVYEVIWEGAENKRSRIGPKHMQGAAGLGLDRFRPVQWLNRSGLVVYKGRRPVFFSISLISFSLFTFPLSRILSSLSIFFFLSFLSFLFFNNYPVRWLAGRSGGATAPEAQTHPFFSSFYSTPPSLYIFNLKNFKTKP
jgi:hypothetical protein